MGTHTPERDRMDVGSPWKYEEPENRYGVAAIVRNEHHEPIANIRLARWGKRKGRKIGHLIAAAPALLAACEAAEAVISRYGAGGGGGDQYIAVQTQLRAAISQARGERSEPNE